MARNIKDTGPAVATTPRGRGRPKGSTAAAAAQKAADMIDAVGKNPTAAAPQTDPDLAPVTAPSFGANEPDAGVFLREVNKIRRQADEVEKKKLELKTEKGKLKDIRKLAAGVGLVMREVDEAIEALNTEHVDLIAREERRRLYFAWLGLPLGTQADLPGMPKATDTEADQFRWHKRGDIAGRLGEVRAVPEGCPPHCIQNFLQGWEHGQTVLMQGSVLTAGAFNPDGSIKSTPGPDMAHEAASTMVTFTEAHFQAGTDLESANLRTLLPGHHESFHNAESVVAVFGSKKRILREPDATIPGGYYVDDGSEDSPVSEAEPAAPTAAEFA